MTSNGYAMLFTSAFILVVWISYALSPVSRLRRRALKTFQDYQSAVTDLSNRCQGICNALPEAAAKYMEGVRVARLRAVPLEALRNYQQGVLLKPLR